MTLAAGSRLGPYDVVGSLGQGGMGEVYRARDSRLKRDVALKVLPAAFAAVPDRVARFQREGELLATLTHQHIAAVYGIEEVPAAGGWPASRALVMELVEGETLADRVQRGPVPVDEALPLARQIAEALDYAHEHGVLHRDLKPANIKVTPDGQVKVLDFGLARALSPDGGAVSQEHSPTITSPAFTQAGVLLGTAAYMSPEQARGKAVDRRADIWAFGCVLYELLTGTRAFEGETISDTLAAVLKSEPDWRRLPTETPAPVRALLRHCLARDPKARLRDIGDAGPRLLTVEDGLDASRPLLPTATWWGRLTLAGAVVAAFVAGRVLIPTSGASLPDASPVVSSIDPPAEAWIGHERSVISPDDQTLALVAYVDGANYLYLRDLAAPTTAWRRVANSQGAWNPFWSPDSSRVAFFAGRFLKTVPTSGAPVENAVEVGRTTNFIGLWEAASFLLSPPFGNAYRIGLRGGEAQVVLPLDANRREVFFRRLLLLPGTDRAIVHIATDQGTGLYAIDLRNPTERELIAADAGEAATLWRDWLLYTRAGSLHAQRLNRDGRIDGTAYLIVPGVGGQGIQNLAVSANGSMVVGAAQNTEGEPFRLEWLDRQGHLAPGIALGSGPRVLSPRLSVDGGWAAYSPTSQTVWVAEVNRSAPQRFATGPRFTSYPLWRRPGVLSWYVESNGIFESSLAAYQPRQLIAPQNLVLYPSDWSPDGETLLVTGVAQTGKATRDIYRWDSATGTLTPWLVTPVDEFGARYSPSGRWVAYHADDSGQFEIYVKPGGGEGLPLRVSTNGGLFPAWRRDERELFFVGRTGGVYAATVSAGTTLSVATPEKLFDARIMADDRLHGAPFDVTPDGQRFLAVVIANPGQPPTLIQNLGALIARAQASTAP